MKTVRQWADSLRHCLDRAAALQGLRLHEDETAAAGNRAVLRTLAATALIAFPVAPVLLSLALPVSLALPLGTVFVAVAALIVGLTALQVTPRIPVTDNVVQAAPTLAQDSGLSYDLFSGLVTVHDPRGNVVGVHGRDLCDFLTFMRDPSGRGFIDQVHVSDRIAFLQAIDELRLGRRHQTIDIRLDRPTVFAEGEQFVHVRCAMSAMLDADGVLMGVVVQSQDVSAEVRLRTEASRMALLAEQANESKTRFLAAVSHELRTPLNAILGFSDILAREYFGRLENERQREYVDLIHSSGHHLLAIVNTMLDMSKIENGRYELLPEYFAVSKAVKSCEAMLGLQAREKGVHLTSRITRTVGEVNADERAFQQILINLVGNAIKFTDAGGMVTIDAETTGSDLRICVSDTGIGIAEDKLCLLGQPFMQIQGDYARKYEGTGLGLSLVKGLVALHGGTFSVRSRTGEGTVIAITLPLDGSGIGHNDETGDMAAARFEFPPRLKGRASHHAGETSRVVTDYEDAGHDGAQTKIA